MEIIKLVLGDIFVHVLNIVDIITNPESFHPVIYSVFKFLKITLTVFSVFLIGMFIFLSSKSKYFNYRFKEDYTERHKGKPYVGVNLKKN